MSDAAGSTTTARQLQDEPVFFPAGGETLFGVITRPSGALPATAVTLLGGGGTFTSTHRNRLYVRLARALAAVGHLAFRFDYHGAGESTGRVDRFSMEEPFVDDLEGALACLDATGVTGHVLVGTCFGSRTLLSYAPRAGGELRGIVLLAPPLSDFRLDPQDAEYRDCAPAGGTGDEWCSSRFVEPLATLVDRGVPVVMVYGQPDFFYRQFEEARAGVLGRLLERAGPGIQLRVVPHPVHAIIPPPAQDALIGLVTREVASMATVDRAAAR